MAENELRRNIKKNIFLIKKNIAEYEQIPLSEVKDSAFIYALGRMGITDYKTISKIQLFCEELDRVLHGRNYKDEYRDCDMFLSEEDNYCPPIKFIFD